MFRRIDSAKALKTWYKIGKKDTWISVMSVVLRRAL